MVPNLTTPPAMVSNVDSILVAAARTGDEQAFERLVRRHQTRVFALALRYTRVHEDAEDIVQQTFHKAFLHLDRFQGRSAFFTWLTRIAINEALQLLRKKRALREVPIQPSTDNDTTEPHSDMADASPDPEIRHLQQESTELLSAAIEQSRPTMRSVLELQLLDVSAQEIARHLGLSVTAVKGRAFHGRKKLREALSQCIAGSDTEIAVKPTQDRLCNSWG